MSGPNTGAIIDAVIGTVLGVAASVGVSSVQECAREYRFKRRLKEKFILTKVKIENEIEKRDYLPVDLTELLNIAFERKDLGYPSWNKLG